MTVLRPIESLADISPEVRGTPIEDLLRYHNMEATHSPYSQAEVLVGMCMDHRERLSFPESFAYIIRSGGQYPTLPVVPLIYRVEDHRLYQLNEQWIQSHAIGGDGPRRSSELTVP